MPYSEDNLIKLLRSENIFVKHGLKLLASKGFKMKENEFRKVMEQLLSLDDKRHDHVVFNIEA